MGVTAGSAAIEWDWILRGRPWCAHEVEVVEIGDGEHYACAECGAEWWYLGVPPPPRGNYDVRS
ncbi:hypothetical protein [Cryptosporangium phraense]|uniref:Uncharacterized protein n=1 Tax=Cryptosporangium phraense TaxID=2593070 RepID=A0A545AEM1_9ACTN|nr:hypothetical protein [Cryptosporangium phraense]TQS39774.1 hypothetical protein FL583_38280 [Cryptosporangium phraense]